MDPHKLIAVPEAFMDVPPSEDCLIFVLLSVQFCVM